MNQQEIQAAFKPFMHPAWRVVGLYKAGNEDAATFSSDNYHLFTAMYFRILKSYGFSPADDEMSDYAIFLSKCMVLTGLMDRFPGRVTDVSEDEIYGACSIFSSAAVQIEHYGSGKFWSYNLISPYGFTFDSFLGRFPCFVGYVRSASGKIMWGWAGYWSVGFIASAFTNETETTGKILSYLQIPIMEKKLIGRLAIWIWKLKMKHTYPGGIKQVLTIYAAAHPMAECARDDFN